MVLRGVCDCKASSDTTPMKGMQDGDPASWSCLQCKQLGRKGENLIIAYGEADSWLPGESRQCLAQLKPLSGIRHQQIVLAVSREPNPAVEEELQRQAPLMSTSPRQNHTMVILSDLSLRIPKLRVPKGVELFRIDSEEKNGLNHRSFGSTIYSRMRNSLLSALQCHDDLLQRQDYTMYHYSWQPAHPFAFLDALRAKPQ